MLRSPAAAPARSACRHPKRRANAFSRRRGAAVVEMALVLPVFFTVVLGIIEFGRAMSVSQMVVQSSREGARLAIVSGSTNSTVESRVKQFVSDTAGVAEDKVSVTITVTAAANNPNPANSVAAANTGDLVNVRVDVPFSDVSLVTGKYLKDNTLRGETSMRHE